MLKSLILATAVAVSAAGAAQAGDHGRFRAAAAGPQPIAEVVNAGGGTVAGTVDKLAANWFTLTDGRDRIDVTTKGFLPEGLQQGQQVTVTGGVRDGAIRASQIVRDDGTAFGRNGDPREVRNERREGERHDLKGHHGERRHSDD